VDEVLRTCQRTWRRLGLTRSEIDAMSDELRADLAAATSEGVDPQEYLGGDAAGVARAWASARGLVRPRYHVVGVMVVALLVTIPMLFAASYIYVASTSAYVADLFRPGWDWVEPGPYDGDGAVRPFVSVPLWLFVGWYIAAAVAGATGILLGVSAYLRRWADPVRVTTLRALAVVLLPAAVVAGLAVAGVSQALAGYNGSLAGQVAQYSTFTVVFVACVGATRAAVVLRGRARRPSPSEDLAVSA
jgi:hypothetical protein